MGQQLSKLYYFGNDKRLGDEMIISNSEKIPQYDNGLFHLLINGGQTTRIPTPAQEEIDKISVVLKCGRGVFKKTGVLPDDIHIKVEELSQHGAAWTLKRGNVALSYCTIALTDFGSEHFWELAKMSRPSNLPEFPELEGARPVSVPWITTTLFDSFHIPRNILLFMAPINSWVAYAVMQYAEESDNK